MNAMLAKIYSYTTTPVSVIPINVEVDVSNGLYDFGIVGLANKVVNEARRKIALAIKNSGYQFPMKRITVSLSPIELPKESSGVEFAIAIGILIASGQIVNRHSEIVLWGELNMEGDLLMPRGIISVLNKIESSKAMAVLPNGNIAIAQHFSNNIQIANNLSEAIGIIENRKTSIEILRKREDPILKTQQNYHEFDLPNNRITRALEIALAGNHHLLVVGPPGIGKTYVCDQVEKLKIPLSEKEIVETSSIYDLAGMLNDEWINYLPVRTIHNSITRAGLIGGGKPFKAGEVLLGHNGIIYMDEFNLFKNEVLQELRSILDLRIITISRGGYKYEYISKTMLIAAMNPCKCGYYRVKNKHCTCNENEIRKYWHKIPGPVLDRLAIGIGIADVAEMKIGQGMTTVNSKELRERIINSKMITNPIDITSLEDFSDIAKNLLEKAVSAFNLNIRNRINLLKVARTIAHLQNREKVEIEHLEEALSLRARIPI